MPRGGKINRALITWEAVSPWMRLCPVTELHLDSTLSSGQTFRWRRVLVPPSPVMDSTVSVPAASVQHPFDVQHIWVGVIAERPYWLWSPVSLQNTCRVDRGDTQGPATPSKPTHDDLGTNAGDTVFFRLGFNPSLESAEAVGDAARSTLRQYFQLAIPYDTLKAMWSGKDAPFPLAGSGSAAITAVRKYVSDVVTVLPAHRVLRQDPWECLIAFVCSQNNNVPRITAMVTSLAERYGQRVEVCCTDAPGAGGAPPLPSAGFADLFAWPTPAALAAAKEEDLRDAGFGYRARYIPLVANAVLQLSAGAPAGPPAADPHLQYAFLERLRGQSPDSVRAALTKLTGVGPKVADCVALFSLDCTSLVPCDTHVLKLAERFMPPSFDYTKVHSDDAYIAASSEILSSIRGVKVEPGETGSMAQPVSQSALLVRQCRIQSFFRAAFGVTAGWAHSVMFATELSSFKAVKSAVSEQSRSSHKRARKASSSA